MSDEKRTIYIGEGREKKPVVVETKKKRTSALDSDAEKRQSPGVGRTEEQR